VPWSRGVSRNDSTTCGTGPAHDAEVDPLGASETDGLERGRDPARHRREVRREHHVATAFPDIQLVGKRARCPAEVRAGHCVEYDLGRCTDRLHERSQRLQPPPEAEVERQRTLSDQPICGPRAEREHGTGGERRGEPFHVLTTITAGPLVGRSRAGPGAAHLAMPAHDRARRSASASSLHAGESMSHAPVLGSTFEGRIVSETTVADRTAIVPAIRGSAWITGITQVLVDPTDPFREGYLLSDTWPGSDA
jgi:proline racemase